MNNGKKDEVINSIEGFTKEFENYIKKNKIKIDHKVSEEEIKNSLTYSFATLALSKNSPVQLIYVINAIKNRYGKHLTQSAIGFLDSMSGKAYGYLALLTTNLKNQEKFHKNALRYFDKAYNNGYTRALADLMEYKKKYMNMEPYRVEEVARTHTNEDVSLFYDLGNLFVDISTLTDNAIRSMKGKRPVIEDMGYFRNAEYKFEKGHESNCGCAVCYGLCKIITGDKEEGLKLVRDNIEGFKKEKGKVERILFSSDCENFNNCIKRIQNELLKINKR